MNVTGDEMSWIYSAVLRKRDEIREHLLTDGWLYLKEKVELELIESIKRKIEEELCKTKTSITVT